MAVNQARNTPVTYPLLVCFADQELAHTCMCACVCVCVVIVTDKTVL